MKPMERNLANETFRPELAKRLSRIGIVFAVIGAISILLPRWATLADVLLVAWILAFWGAAGLWFAWEMRPAREWRFAAMVFGIAFLLGLIFLISPLAGITTLTILLLLVILTEGVVSIMLGLRMSGHLSNWGWMVFSGLCSLIVGLIILLGWPETAGWALGLLLGLNFLSTGFALIMLGRTAKEPV